jgi:hypothetical protein
LATWALLVAFERLVAYESSGFAEVDDAAKPDVEG